ncbi:hypothetical protein ACOME3_003965 [Neoechinorhynchus agilis]
MYKQAPYFDESSMFISTIAGMYTMKSYTDDIDRRLFQNSSPVKPVEISIFLNKHSRMNQCVQYALAVLFAGNVKVNVESQHNGIPYARSELSFYGFLFKIVLTDTEVLIVVKLVDMMFDDRRLDRVDRVLEMDWVEKINGAADKKQLVDEISGNIGEGFVCGTKKPSSIDIIVYGLTNGDVTNTRWGSMMEKLRL